MSKAVFKMVRYKKWDYYKDIPLNFCEVPSHFDCSSLSFDRKYSLHTEYSYGPRKLNSKLLTGLNSIKKSVDNMHIPLLWHDKNWSNDFAEFIIRLVGKKQAPSVIEIHPPYKEYTNLVSFVKNYSIFERKILKEYPDTQIVIENRCGSRHRGGFLVQTLEDIIALAKQLSSKRLHLKIALDFPQLYTAHHIDEFNDSSYIELIKSLKPIRNQIGSIHLWGKKISPITGKRTAHAGDLYSFFNEDQKVKNKFVKEFANLFNDGKARWLVLEVNNSNESLNSIVDDLKKEVKFI